MTPKTIDEIAEQCAAQGLLLLREAFDKEESSWVVVKAPESFAFYNPKNGVFEGRTPDNIRFHSHQMRHPGVPWYEALVKFFHKGG